LTTLGEALVRAEARLNLSGVEDARAEARLLLQHTLRIASAHLYSHPEQTLSTAEAGRFRDLVSRRAKHEPTAYIFESQPFFGREFFVDGRVLIPRPETEVLVQMALESMRGHRAPVVADVGTGCGAIAITLAMENPDLRIYGVDVSARALEVARINCLRYNVADRVTLLLGDLLDPVPGKVDMVVANLPYVADPDLATLSPEIARYEPRIALSGGPDGLRLIRSLLQRATTRLASGGRVLLEIGHNQEAPVLSMVGTCSPEAEGQAFQDFNGLSRVVTINLRNDFTQGGS